MRDKIISIRINSSILEEFNKIVDSNTHSFESYGRRYYSCSLGKRSFLSNKYTISDFLEEKLREFILSRK